MIESIYVLYENSDKYYPTYEQAYFNSLKPMQKKGVRYVFTPTMCSYKRVSELENAYRKYFNKVADCDYYDLHTRESFKQLNILKGEK